MPQRQRQLPRVLALQISKKGMVFKTYEGQLNVQTFGAIRGDNPILEAFDFSVAASEEQVVQDLQTVALSGERVILHYEARYVVFPLSKETNKTIPGSNDEFSNDLNPLDVRVMNFGQRGRGLLTVDR